MWSSVASGARHARFVLVSLLLLAALPAPLLAAYEPVTDPGIEVTHPRPLYDRRTRTYWLDVTVTHQGAEALSGPLRLVVESANKTLVNGHGSNGAGEPYADLSTAADARLAPGDNIGYRLGFQGGRGQLVATLRLERDVPETVNRPPVADAGDDQSLTLAPGASTLQVTLDGSGSSDPDGTIARYEWPGVPDPADVEQPMLDLGVGTYRFSLVVYDDVNKPSVVDTVEVIVAAATPTNQQPTANAGQDRTLQVQSGEQTVTLTLDGSASSDPDGSVVRWVWTGDVDPDDVARPELALAAGTYLFNLVVVDDAGAESAPSTVTIEVLPYVAPNAAPVAAASAPATIALPVGRDRVSVRLDGSGSSDSDGTLTSYAWSGDTADPADLEIVQLDLPLGSHRFELRVTDNNGAVSAPAVVVVEVTAAPTPSAPILTVQGTPPFLVDQGSALQIEVSANDPDGEPVSIGAQTALSNATFTATNGVMASGTLQVTPQAGQQGVYQVTFSARDPAGFSTTETIAIEIADQNQAPTLTVPTTASIDEGRELSVAVQANDPDHDPVQINVVGLPENAVFLQATKTLVFLPDFEQAGQWPVTFTADDGTATSDPQTLTITVNDVGSGQAGGGDLALVVDPVQTPTLLRTQRITGAVNAPSAEPQAADASMGVLTGVSPTSARQGETVEVRLTAASSGPFPARFVTGISSADFGRGIAVEALEVEGEHQAVATIRVDADADTGLRSVRVTSGNEIALAIPAFEVRPGLARIGGRLVDPDTGDPVSGGTATLQGTGRSGTVGADGSFSIDNVPPGDYQLVVNAPNRTLIRLDVSVDAGSTVTLGDLQSRATVFDPDAPPAANVLGSIGRGATTMPFEGDLEDAKQVIRDAIQVIGGTEYGFLDEFGNQANPNVEGPGQASLKFEAIEPMALRWQIGEAKTIGPMLAGFLFAMEWQGGDAPTPFQMLAAIQQEVDEAWADPTNPDNALPILLFNTGRTLDPQPPVISPSTPLNPLQSYLFLTTLLGYANDQLFYQDLLDDDGNLLTGPTAASASALASNATSGAESLQLAAMGWQEGLPGETMTDVPLMLAQAGNQPPVADAGPDQTIRIMVGRSLPETIRLDGRGSSDPDGSIAKYLWFRTSSRDPDPDDVVRPEVKLGEGRKHSFRLIVQDDDGELSAPSEVTIILDGECGIVNGRNPASISWCGIFQKVGEGRATGVISDVLDNVTGTSGAQGPVDRMIQNLFPSTTVQSSGSKALFETWVNFSKGVGVNVDLEARAQLQASYLDQYKGIQAAQREAQALNRATTWANGVSSIMKDALGAFVGDVADALFKQLILNNLINGFVASARPQPPTISGAEVLRDAEGIPDAVRLSFSPSPEELSAAANGTNWRFTYAIYRQDPVRGFRKLAMLPSYDFYAPLSNRDLPRAQKQEVFRAWLERHPETELSFVDADPLLATNSYRIVTRVIRHPVPTKPYTPPEAKMAYELMLSRVGPGATAIGKALFDVQDAFADIFIGLAYQISEPSEQFLVSVGAVAQLDTPRVDLAVAERTGDAYMSLPGSNQILRWNTDGLSYFADAGFKKPPGQVGLGVDAFGNVYTDNKASDANFGGRIFRFDSAANRALIGSVNYYSALLSYARAVDVRAMTHAYDMADGEPVLFIAELTENRITRLDLRDGRTLGPIWQDRNVSQRYSRDPQLNIQGDSQLHYNLGDLYVTQGPDLLQIGPDGVAWSAFEFLQPNQNNPFAGAWFTGIDTDAWGDLYVADKFGGTVYKVPRFVVDQGAVGSDPDFLQRYRVLDGLDTPLALALTADQRSMIVVDQSGLRRIGFGISGRVWDQERDTYLANALMILDDEVLGSTDAQGYFRFTDLGAETFGSRDLVIQSSDGRVGRQSLYIPAGTGQKVFENDLAFVADARIEALDEEVDTDLIEQEPSPFPATGPEFVVNADDLGTTITTHFVLPKPRLVLSGAQLEAAGLDEMPEGAAPIIDADLDEPDRPDQRTTTRADGGAQTQRVYRLPVRLEQPLPGLKLPASRDGTTTVPVAGIVVPEADHPGPLPAEVVVTANGRSQRVPVIDRRFEAQLELDAGISEMAITTEPDAVFGPDGIEAPTRFSSLVVAGPYGENADETPLPDTLKPNDPLSKLEAAFGSADLDAVEVATGGAHTELGADAYVSARAPDEGIGFTGFVVQRETPADRPQPASGINVAVYDLDAPDGPRLLAEGETDELGWFGVLVPADSLKDSPSDPPPTPGDPSSMPDRRLQLVAEEVTHSLQQDRGETP
ncbi:MAG: PKD domain-containing protein [Wenzhouxiangella sp.]|nr:PKD domain-containing protein [Wenzhouxiangella sp.]